MDVSAYYLKNVHEMPQRRLAKNNKKKGAAQVLSIYFPKAKHQIISFEAAKVVNSHSHPFQEKVWAPQKMRKRLKGRRTEESEGQNRKPPDEKTEGPKKEEILEGTKEGQNKTLKEEILEQAESTTAVIGDSAVEWKEPKRPRKIVTSSLLQKRRRRKKKEKPQGQSQGPPNQQGGPGGSQQGPPQSQGQQPPRRGPGGADAQPPPPASLPPQGPPSLGHNGPPAPQQLAEGPPAHSGGPPSGTSTLTRERIAIIDPTTRLEVSVDGTSAEKKVCTVI